MNTKTLTIAVVVLIICLALILRAQANDNELQTISRCVVHTAELEGFSGNPYGQKAWDTFAESCKGRTYDFVGGENPYIYDFTTGGYSSLPQGTHEDDIIIIK